SFALIQFRLGNGEWVTKTVRVIGIDPKSRAALGGFKEYLLDPENQKDPSFKLSPAAQARYDRAVKRFEDEIRWERQRAQVEDPLPVVAPLPTPDSKPPQPPGIILGHALASYRKKGANADGSAKDVYMLEPGDSVVAITYKGARNLKPGPPQKYIVCDYFKSGMSEYDANLVFVSLDQLQEIRGMKNRVNSIQIKLKNYDDAPEVLRVLQEMFPGPYYQVETWEEKQSTLLAAIQIEKGILNVLLFLIIGVAGFGILAIFTMIVAEKTRDIGILKALGASNAGVAKIFLGYGLLLGVLGAGLGTLLGLTLTDNINGI